MHKFVSFLVTRRESWLSLLKLNFLCLFTVNVMWLFLPVPRSDHFCKTTRLVVSRIQRVKYMV